jgi:hypothetical protein
VIIVKTHAITRATERCAELEQRFATQTKAAVRSGKVTR